jgi:UDP-3-O-[3-hydroxymyristoyl] glucosamine N-acyltransferase
VPITLAELALRVGAMLDGDGTVQVSHVATLESAGTGAIVFLANRRYRAQLAATRASAVIVTPAMAGATALPKLLDRNPYASYAKVAAILHPIPAVVAGVHPSAVIEPGAKVAPSAAIGPHAVIGAMAVVGERARVGAGTYVGAGASIGDDVTLHANVTIYERCVVGPRSILHSGAVIGADGFGMAEDNGRWVKIPQLGRVVLGADVEIGANTTIDRGAIDDTVIEDDVKLDNLIQVGHNCHIGAHTAMAGCAGVAGSTRIGRNCKIGARANLNGHIEICDNVNIAATANVHSSISVPGTYASAVFLALPHDQWRRRQFIVQRLPELAQRVRRLEGGGGGTAEDAPDETKGEP